nr:DUF2142 domain-containing protein [Azospirillum argentinense]
MLAWCCCWPAPPKSWVRRPDGRQLAVAWLSVGASFLGILVIQYLSFSRVGGTFVEGVQGRYFLPLAAAAGLLMPAIAARRRRCGWRRRSRFWSSPSPRC